MSKEGMLRVNADEEEEEDREAPSRGIKKEGPILVHLQQIERLLNIHHNKLQQLHHRLAPILSKPAGTESKGSKDEVGPASAVSNRLGSIVESIQVATSSAEDLLRRLQL